MLMAAEKDSQVDDKGIAPPSDPSISSSPPSGSKFIYSIAVADPSDGDHFVAEPPAGEFMVRSQTYLQNRVKVPSAKQILPLMGVDLIQYSNGEKPLQTAFGLSGSTASSVPVGYAAFTVHFQVPTVPEHSLAITFGRPIDDGPLPPLVQRFLEGIDCNETFKLIPAVREGPWLVRTGVGSSPVLIAKQIACSWHRLRSHQLECVVDVASDSVARAILGLISGATRHLVIDLAFLVEATEEADLPECLLGAVRLGRIDLSRAVPLASLD